MSVTEVASHGLCISCELCKAICPSNAIKMVLNGGQHVPVVNENKCDGCNTCINVCPSINSDPGGMVAEGPADCYSRPGRNLSCYAIKLKDKGILSQVTSGGAITGIGLALIEKRAYDYISILDNVYSYKELPTLRLTDDPEQIVRSAKSKYVPVSAYELAGNLEEMKDKRIIIVATACILNGIENYSRIKGVDLGKALMIGLFCDRTMSLNFIEYCARTYCKKEENIERLDYRNKLSGGWPGNMQIAFNSGRITNIDRKDRIDLKPYFQLQRCLFCSDKLNRVADISVGDCYVKRLQNNEGKSSVIIRTGRGRVAFDIAAPRFEVEALDYDEIWQSQNVESKARSVKWDGTNPAISEQRNKYELMSREADSSIRIEQKKIKLGRDLNIMKIRLSMIRTRAGYKARRYLKYFVGMLLLAIRIIIDLPSLMIREYELKSKNKTIGILGVNSSNLGAQAMALSGLELARKKYPEARLVLLVGDYEMEMWKWKEFNVDLLPWNNNAQLALLMPSFIRRMLMAYKPFSDFYTEIADSYQIDEFLDLSGYALTSKWRWTATVAYIVNIMVAKRLKARMLLLPQAFGPWQYPHFIRPVIHILMKLYMRYPEQIYPRDSDSQIYISKYKKGVGIAQDIVLVSPGPDTGILLKPCVQVKEHNIVNKSVGIIPNKQVCIRIGEPAFFTFVDDLIAVLTENGFDVYILAYSLDDKYLCNAIYERNKIKIVSENLIIDVNAIEAELVIKNLCFIVALRYHSIIHAYKNGVPAIVSGWAHKYRWLLREFDQEQYLIDLCDLQDRGTYMELFKNMMISYEIEGRKVEEVLKVKKANYPPVI